MRGHVASSVKILAEEFRKGSLCNLILRSVLRLKCKCVETSFV